MKKYIITYYTQLDNGYIDERQIIIRNKYNAKRVYNSLAGEKRTINIEMEELWNIQLIIEFLSTIETILYC